MNRPIKILAGLLLATAIFAQVIILEPKDGAVSRINKISVTIAGKAGAPATLFINGSEAAHEIIRIDGLLDFLNVEAPAGPVNIKVEAEGASGRIFTAERGIHVLGTVNQIVNISDPIGLDADGRSTGEFRFEIQDEWGYRLNHINNASIRISSGTIVTEDLDKESSGTQTMGEEGIIKLTVQSALEATERASLEITVRGHTESFPVHYSIPEEPILVVGAVNAGLSTLAKDQDPNSLPHFGLININNTKLGDHALLGGRAAFYAKGSIKPGLRLTASLDTDRGYLDQLFVDVDPEELYPVFGDASSISYDAQSRSKL
ncbi:MAG: hypothetical protein U9Q77_07625, partial [Candidatus Marinimicrobia bacterium]|nr:hypothetical protein [Candidatus Neomarinimicrobiota bacterium]